MSARMATAVALVAMATASLAGSPASAGADAGPPFLPAPASRPIYAVSAPSANPAQRHHVRGAEGTDIYVERWLPATREGRKPPARLPTVLITSPYEDLTKPADGRFEEAFAAYMAQRGYAAAIAHVRGTSRSGGCLEYWGPRETEDTLRVIDYLAHRAPRASGLVGMYGLSYQASAQLGPATSGDPRTRALRAIVPIAGPGSFYQAVAADGVPFTAVSPLAPAFYLQFGVAPEGPGLPTAERAGCTPANARGVRVDGAFRHYDAEREHRRGLGRLRAATLLVQGLADDFVTPALTAGFFDRIPPGTPHRAVIGQWDHTWPDHVWPQSPRDWRRADWMDMVVAWYDEHLKGIPTGTAAWPPVQVQGPDGQWRAEPAWPTTGGPAGQLALGPGGRLGARRPRGGTAFAQTSLTRDYYGALDGDSRSAVFSTPPLRRALHITGQPEVDLWVRVGDPAARIAARLHALDADGRQLTALPIVGVRSVQFNEPLTSGRFEQWRPVDPPLGRPFRVRVRLAAVDAIVPPGGRLELELAGATTWYVVGFETTTMLAPGPGSVEVLHDCRHPSALRFLMRRRRPAVFDVREPGERALGEVAPATGGALPDGGLARARVCGRAPIRSDVLGPRRRAVRWP